MSKRIFDPSLFIKYVKVMNLYPPFIGAGIRVKEVNEDRTRFVVQLRRKWFNRNINGTHFGGSLYSMSDPFYVFACYTTFGDDYIYWDKSASIKYIRPGKGRVTGIFEIPPTKLEAMKKEVDSVGKMTYTFTTLLTHDGGSPVAEITKEIYIKKK